MLISNLMIGISIASAISSTTIWVPFILSPKLRSRSYMVVVFFMAISDFLNALGSAMGLPASGSFACWFEGIMTNVFSLASILWTVVIMMMMYSIVVNGKMVVITKWHHLLCWGLPLFVSLIPLINVTYGSYNDWCWLIPTKNSPGWAMPVWQWVNFYGIIWGSFLAMITIFCALMYEININVHSASKDVVRKVFRKLQFYPLVIAFCWLLPCFSDLYFAAPEYADSATQRELDIIAIITTIQPCAQGFLTTVVFWWSNADVRKQVLNGFSTGTLGAGALSYMSSINMHDHEPETMLHAASQLALTAAHKILDPLHILHHSLHNSADSAHSHSQSHSRSDAGDAITQVDPGSRKSEAGASCDTRTYDAAVSRVGGLRSPSPGLGAGGSGSGDNSGTLSGTYSTHQRLAHANKKFSMQKEEASRVRGSQSSCNSDAQNSEILIDSAFASASGSSGGGGGGSGSGRSPLSSPYHKSIFSNQFSGWVQAILRSGSDDLDEIDSFKFKSVRRAFGLVSEQLPDSTRSAGAEGTGGDVETGGEGGSVGDARTSVYKVSSRGKPSGKQSSKRSARVYVDRDDDEGLTPQEGDAETVVGAYLNICDDDDVMKIGSNDKDDSEQAMGSPSQLRSVTRGGVDQIEMGALERRHSSENGLDVHHTHHHHHQHQHHSAAVLATVAAAGLSHHANAALPPLVDHTKIDHHAFVEERGLGRLDSGGSAGIFSSRNDSGGSIDDKFGRLVSGYKFYM